MSDFEIRPIDCSDAALEGYCQLFAECFPATANYSVNYLKWLYTENPRGQAVGFDAWSQGVLAAHYVCVPVHYQRDGRLVTGILSLNTATREAFRGKGLFPRLAEATYAEAARLGFDFVIGVANANSTPGFVKRLGFDLISPLDAKIGAAIGVAGVGSAAFSSLWDQETLSWRRRSPRNPVFAHDAHGGARLWADAGRKPFIVVAERRGVAFDRAGSGPMPWRPQLFIGLVPPATGYRGIAIDVPERFRASPLNLIFRVLSANLGVPAKADIGFDFLDFDAF